MNKWAFILNNKKAELEQLGYKVEFSKVKVVDKETVSLYKHYKTIDVQSPRIPDNAVIGTVTTCRVQNSNVDIVGMSLCSPSEAIYIKEKGRLIALGRAIALINEPGVIRYFNFAYHVIPTIGFREQLKQHINALDTRVKWLMAVDSEQIVV